ncbi:MAG: hypothetical protein OEY11_14120 [Gammaproteobacteria bacterium]|nr:hypothetical protein [Gammaproteobacteria bacterium]
MDLNPLQNHYLISVKRPGHWLLSILGILVVIGLSMWLVYERGRIAGGYDSIAAAGRVDELEQSLAELQSEMANMQSTNTSLERNNHIEKDANRQVKETIVKLQDDILKLNEEVTFYRSIVSPEKTQRRLFMQDLRFVRKAANEFDYKIVVTQRGNNHRVVRGIMHVTFDGQKDGQPFSIDMGKLVQSEVNNAFKLGFKYFQRFQGTVIIPEGFVPSTLRVQVVPNSTRLVRLDKTVDWTSVSSEGDKSDVGEQKRQLGQS